jgi:chromosome segregation ATPase
MNQTETTQTVSMTDLDRLTERVEKAASLVQQLRDDRARLDREREELNGRIQDLEQKLQSADAQGQDLVNLRREQRDWTTERREIATRVESLIKKLERLEG